MDNKNSSSPARGLQILRVVLYILAGTILTFGLIGAISLMTSASHVAANLALPFQLMGNQAISSMITPLLSGFLINLGVIVLVVSLALSALLYTLVRLIAHVAQLELRVSELEKRN